MNSIQQYLQISNQNLIFQPIQNHYEGQFTLQNISDKKVLYKVKCTKPQLFILKSSKGVIPVGQTQIIQCYFNDKVLNVNDANEIQNQIQDEKFSVSAITIDESSFEANKNQLDGFITNLIKNETMKLQIVKIRVSIDGNPQKPLENSSAHSNLKQTTYFDMDKSSNLKQSQYSNSNDPVKKQFLDTSAKYANFLNQTNKMKEERNAAYQELRKFKQKNQTTKKFQKKYLIYIFILLILFFGWRYYSSLQQNELPIYPSNI